MLDSYQLAALDLVAEALQAGSPQRLRVSGSSMLPALRPGDWLTIAPVPAESLQPGDLVLVRRPADLVTHRLIRAGAHGWQTKGDALHHPDPLLERRALLGQVVTYERGGKTADLRQARWRAANRILGRLGRWEAAAFAWGDRLSGRWGGRTARRLGYGVSRMIALPVWLFRWVLVWILGG